MPFVLERPILDEIHKRTGLPHLRVEIPLAVLGGPRGERLYTFYFDTACVITTVGEDVAGGLGLPPGGDPLEITGATGKVVGRRVTVRYRFPPECEVREDGTREWRAGLEASSTWVVVPGGRKRLALLAFADVHRHFSVQTDRANAYFCRWADVPAG